MAPLMVFDMLILAMDDLKFLMVFINQYFIIYTFYFHWPEIA